MIDPIVYYPRAVEPTGVWRLPKPAPRNARPKG